MDGTSEPTSVHLGPALVTHFTPPTVLGGAKSIAAPIGGDLHLAAPLRREVLVEALSEDVVLGDWTGAHIPDILVICLRV